MCAYTFYNKNIDKVQNLDGSLYHCGNITLLINGELKFYTVKNGKIVGYK
jgi:hypothetical protein